MNGGDDVDDPPPLVQAIVEYRAAFRAMLDEKKTANKEIDAEEAKTGKISPSAVTRHNRRMAKAIRLRDLAVAKVLYAYRHPRNWAGGRVRPDLPLPADLAEAAAGIVFKNAQKAGKEPNPGIATAAEFAAAYIRAAKEWPDYFEDRRPLKTVQDLFGMASEQSVSATVRRWKGDEQTDPNRLLDQFLKSDVLVHVVASARRRPAVGAELATVRDTAGICLGSGGFSESHALHAFAKHMKDRLEVGAQVYKGRSKSKEIRGKLLAI